MNRHQKLLFLSYINHHTENPLLEWHVNQLTSNIDLYGRRYIKRMVDVSDKPANPTGLLVTFIRKYNLRAKPLQSIKNNYKDPENKKWDDKIANLNKHLEMLNLPTEN
jgi:hypothetical protein